jgi:hypothetical protein
MAAGGQIILMLGGSSMLSSDGTNFSPVSAPAVSFPVNGGSVSVVSVPGGGSRMYFFPPAISSAFSYVNSSDGLHYCDEPSGACAVGSQAAGSLAGTPVTGMPSGLAWIKVVAVPSGGYRAYYGSAGATSAIGSAFSSDGKTFADEGARVPGGSLGFFEPSVVYLTSAGWLMTMSTQGRQQGYDDIYLATSSDGLSWTVDTGPVLTSANGKSFYYSSLIATGPSSARVYAMQNDGVRSYLNSNQPIVSGVISRTSGSASPANFVAAPWVSPPVARSRR